MPRIQGASSQNVDPAVEHIYKRMFGDRDPVVSPGTVNGIGNFWTVLANAPGILVHIDAAFQVLLRDPRELPVALRQLAIMRSGFIVGSLFVFSNHCKVSRNAGLSEAKIAAVPAWASSNEFDGLERAVLEYTDNLLLSDGRVQDATFDRLAADLSNAAIVELTYLIGFYRQLATTCRALRLELDDIDERITEVQ